MARYDLSGNLIPEPEDTGAPAYRAPGPPPDLASGPSAAPPPYGQPPAAKEPAPWAGHPTPGLNAPLPNPNRPPTAAAPPHAPRPAPGGGGWQAAPYDNLYQGNDSGRNAGVPPEVAALRWNWGAFFLPPMWCAAHGAPAIGYFYDLVGIFFLLSPFLFGPTWGILIFFTTAFLLFGTGVYLGACGNEIAWKNRIFDNGVDGFFQVQRSWTISSFAIALPLYAILFSAFSYQVVRASHRQQALLDQALAARAASETAPPPAAAMLPRQVFQQNPQQPTQTIIYGHIPSREEYMNRNSRYGPPMPGGMVGRAPVTIIVTPRAPGAGEPQGAPGFQGAPNAQGAPSSEQPVSPPAGQYEQPAPSPEQNPAPQPAPYQNAPEQNTAPPQEPAQGAYPGLPPGQQ